MRNNLAFSSFTLATVGIQIQGAAPSKCQDMILNMVNTGRTHQKPAYNSIEFSCTTLGFPRASAGTSATLPRPQFSTKGSAAISCCPEGRVHFGAPPRVSSPGFRALGPLRRTPWYRTYRIVRFVSVRRYSFFSHRAPFLGLNETRATNILQANWSLPLCVITCHNHVHVVGIHVSGIAIFFPPSPASSHCRTLPTRTPTLTP